MNSGKSIITASEIINQAVARAPQIEVEPTQELMNAFKGIIAKSNLPFKLNEKTFVVSLLRDKYEILNVKKSNGRVEARVHRFLRDSTYVTSDTTSIKLACELLSKLATSYRANQASASIDDLTVGYDVITLTDSLGHDDILYFEIEQSIGDPDVVIKYDNVAGDEVHFSFKKNTYDYLSPAEIAKSPEAHKIIKQALIAYESVMIAERDAKVAQENAKIDQLKKAIKRL
jgi:hypothetical protein